MTGIPSDLAPEFAKVATVQTYRAKQTIAGVELKEIRRFVEEGGEFAEVTRLAPDGGLPEFPGFRVRQISHSIVEPGAIKAFHVHARQEDVWFVPPQSRLLVGLLDARAASPTKGAAMRLLLGDGRGHLVYIPAGVGHGVANLSDRPSAMLYLVSEHFRADAPDEGRLPWDILGADFWSIRPG